MGRINDLSLYSHTPPHKDIVVLELASGLLYSMLTVLFSGCNNEECL